jgi:hypothetical protein
MGIGYQGRRLFPTNQAKPWSVRRKLDDGVSSNQFAEQLPIAAAIMAFRKIKVDVNTIYG